MVRRRRLRRQPPLRASGEARARLLLLDDLLEQRLEVRDGADARVGLRRPARLVLRPAAAEHAHLDLLTQELELLRLRLAAQRGRQLLLALEALLLPRLEELQRVGVGIDSRVEQHRQALLTPRQLVGVVRLQRDAAVGASVLR